MTITKSTIKGPHGNAMEVVEIEVTPTPIPTTDRRWRMTHQELIAALEKDGSEVTPTRKLSS